MRLYVTDVNRPVRQTVMGTLLLKENTLQGDKESERLWGSVDRSAPLTRHACLHAPVPEKRYDYHLDKTFGSQRKLRRKPCFINQVITAFTPPGFIISLRWSVMPACSSMGCLLGHDMPLCNGEWYFLLFVSVHNRKLQNSWQGAVFYVEIAQSRFFGTYMNCQRTLGHC